MSHVSSCSETAILRPQRRRAVFLTAAKASEGAGRGFAGLEALAELRGLGLKLLVGERLVRALELVDLNDDGPAVVEKLTVMAA